MQIAAKTATAVIQIIYLYLFVLSVPGAPLSRRTILSYPARLEQSRSAGFRRPRRKNPGG
jgi:hypothetical protein